MKSDGNDPDVSKVARQPSVDTNKLLKPLLAHSTMAAIILLFLLSLHDTQITMAAFLFFLFGWHE